MLVLQKLLIKKSDKSTVCSNLIIDKKENSKQASESTSIKITIAASLLPGTTIFEQLLCVRCVTIPKFS